jgi:hypothetical protein
MLKRSLLTGSLLFPAILILAGCASMNEVQPYELVPVMSKLTMAAQEVIVIPKDGIHVPDDRILYEAFNERPELMESFRGLNIFIKRYGNDVVLLVCSPDGKHAWIEDASWTPEVDVEWYETDPSHPAVFSLNPPRGSRGPSN